MGRYRTDLTFQLTAPDEVRIYLDKAYIGDIYKDEDVLNAGQIPLPHLAHRGLAGVEARDRPQPTPSRDGAMGGHPSVLLVSATVFGRVASRPGFPLESPAAGAASDNRSNPSRLRGLRPLRAALGRDGCQAGVRFGRRARPNRRWGRCRWRGIGTPT